MPNLTLDHTQRLNLHALIGAQKASVDDMRLYWRVQDRIELTQEEKDAIGYQMRQVNGQQQIAWDATRGVSPREFEFSNEEVQKMHHAVKTWQPGYMIAGDRMWLEPLLHQLEQSPNGQPK